MKLLRVPLLVSVLLSFALAAAAQDSIVFVVRHAERAGTPAANMTGAQDPPLSPAGQQRAERLAKMLQSAGIRHIFITEFQRTRQTAAPLAAAGGVQPVAVAANDVDALVTGVTRSMEPTLVVGHGNTVPEILRKLGVREPIALGDQEYDNLFIVIRHPAAPATLVRLRF